MVSTLSANVTRAPSSGFQRGMNFDHLGGFEAHMDSSAVSSSFDSLVGLGVDHVSITPSFFQHTLEDTSFFMKRPRERVFEDTRVALRLAKERGLSVLLKPHLWVDDRSNGAWRGLIDQADRDRVTGANRVAFAGC